MHTNLIADGVIGQVSNILAWLVLVLLPWCIYKFLQKFMSLKEKSLKIIYLVLPIVYITIAVFVFPGFTSLDDVTGISAIMNGHAFGWFSLTYSLILSTSLVLIGSYGATSIFSLSLFLYLSLKIFNYIDRSSLKTWSKNSLALIFVALCLHPFNQTMIFFQNRDVLFSLLLVFLGMKFFDKNPWTSVQIIVYCLLLILIGDLRQEAKMYLVIVPCLCIFLKLWSRQQIILSVIIIAAGSYVYYYKAAEIFSSQSYSYRYQSTPFVLPISQIFHDLEPEKISDEHKQNIARVFDLDLLKNKYSALNIIPFYQGAYIFKNENPKDWEKFKASAIELILENKWLYLNGRITLMGSMLNIGAYPSIYYDELRYPRENNVDISTQIQLDVGKQTQLLKTVAPLDQKTRAYYGILNGMLKSRHALALLFMSLLLPLTFLFYAVTLVFEYAELACFAYVVGVQFAIISLLAPCNATKYIYSLYLFFSTGLILFMIRFFEKKQKA